MAQNLNFQRTKIPLGFTIQGQTQSLLQALRHYGDAPEAGGPESLTSSDGSGVEDIESLKSQEDSGPRGPTSVSSGLRSRGGTSYGPPKTAGAGSIESVNSTSPNYDVLYNKSPKSSKSARKSAESKMLAAGQIPVSETTSPTKLIIAAVIVVIITIILIVLIAIVASHGHESDSGKLFNFQFSDKVLLDT